MGELTPSRMITLAPGAHKLDLSNASVFYRDSRNFKFSPVQTVPVAVPGTAKITVETFPGSDKVSVDGARRVVQRAGTGFITVSRGRHVITVKGTKQTVDVAGDQKVKFKI